MGVEHCCQGVYGRADASRVARGLVVEKAKAFAASGELKTALAKAGVVSAPGDSFRRQRGALTTLKPGERQA